MKETVLITGGTGLIGRLFVEHLLEAGYDVVFTSTSAAKKDALCEELSGRGDGITGIVANFLEADSVTQIIREIEDRSLSVNHLINNARSFQTLALEEDGTVRRENFLGELTIGMVAPYELSVGLAKQSPRTLKSIINIGSQYGLVAPNPALYGGSLAQSPIQYGVTKAALVHLTKELAVRMAPENIRVNCIAYGGLEGRVDEAFKARYAELVPSRRMLTKADIPEPLAFLLSPGSAAITGQVLAVDGGWTAW